MAVLQADYSSIPFKPVTEPCTQLLNSVLMVCKVAVGDDFPAPNTDKLKTLLNTVAALTNPLSRCVTPIIKRVVYKCTYAHTCVCVCANVLT